MSGFESSSFGLWPRHPRIYAFKNPKTSKKTLKKPKKTEKNLKNSETRKLYNSCALRIQLAGAGTLW